MGRKSLEPILHYILNEADDAELDVISKAVERRKQDATKFAAIGGFNPGAMADRMSSSINESLSESLSSIRQTVRDYVEEIILKNAPDISDKELAVLLDYYVGKAERDFADQASRVGQTGQRPNGQGAGQPDAFGVDPGKGVVDFDLQQSGLPPEAMLSMVRDFVEYSTGAMPPSKQKELWEWMSNWKDNYWNAFPDSLKSLIKALLEKRIDADEFWKVVLSMLGL